MFPRSLVFFIIMMMVDIFLKSIKEKKNIQKTRKPVGKGQEIPNSTKSKTSKMDEAKKMFEDVQRRIENIEWNEKPKETQGSKKAEKFEKAQQRAEKARRNFRSEKVDNFETSFDSKAIYTSSRIGDKPVDKIKKTGKSKIEEGEIGDSGLSQERLQEDVLRGIIFSEILSSPKALNRDRKNI